MIQKLPVDETVGRSSRIPNIALLVVGVIAVSVMSVLLFGHIDRGVTGMLVVALMLVLMLMGLPVGIAMMVASLVGLWRLTNTGAVEGALGEVAFSSVASWSYSVIPMFVLMGIILAKSGLTASVYRVAEMWTRRLPGGLALATNFSGAGLAASSGSSIGITFALGRVAIPEMIRAGYKPTLATGSLAMSGALGQIIPPSVLLVIYAGVAQVPVGPQLLAGVVPGVLLALVFGAVIVLWATLQPSVAPRNGEVVSWTVKLSSLVHTIPIVTIVAVVMGGLYLGMFTATEAGAFGVAVAMIFGLLAVVRERERSGVTVRSFLSGSFMDTVASVAAVFLLLIGVHMLTRVMALSGLAQALADFVVDLGLNQFTFLLLLIGVYLVLGMFVDTLAMMLLTIPVLMGPLNALDVNLLWFGVFLVVLAEVGQVSPPLGILAFVVYGIAESSTRELGVRVSLLDVFKGVIPFVLVVLVVLVLMIRFPEIVTWLPSRSEV